ncbi:ATP-binding protein [Yinghuangia sp. YIM S09857]|uniref:ATP-binding protein n=1 Tax=Yinghuangia sp. YIM S09857 TaxID=3436929 RepID=UPI003F529555
MSEPVTRTYVLPDMPESAKLARDHVRGPLFAHKLPHLSDDAALLASELISNALLHAEGRPELRLQLRESTFRIEVVDSGYGVPKAPLPGVERTFGRGLWIVERLSCRWGFVRDIASKSVWCDLPTRSVTPQ